MPPAQTFEPVVGHTPAAPDHEAVDLAPQAQPEHRFQPHQRQAGQADGPRQCSADAAVRDDGHGQRNGESESPGKPFGLGRHPLRRVTPGHPSGDDPAGAPFEPRRHPKQEVDEEERADGADRPEQLVEVGVHERNRAERQRDAGSGLGLMLVHCCCAHLLAIDDALRTDMVGLCDQGCLPPPDPQHLTEILQNRRRWLRSSRTRSRPVWRGSRSTAEPATQPPAPVRARQPSATRRTHDHRRSAATTPPGIPTRRR